MAGQHQQQDLARQAVDRFKQRANEYASGIAQRMGPPAGGTKLTNEQIHGLWLFSPEPNPDQAHQQLVSQGMSPGQAMDKVWPYRRKLFQAPTVAEQVKKAESIAAMVEGHAEQASKP